MEECINGMTEELVNGHKGKGTDGYKTVIFAVGLKIMSLHFL